MARRIINCYTYARPAPKPTQEVLRANCQQSLHPHSGAIQVLPYEAPNEAPCPCELPKPSSRKCPFRRRDGRNDYDIKARADTLLDGGST